MLTIYVDVLIVLNLYVSFFLLKITAKLMHFPARTGRTLLAALYASLYSLLILAPEIPAVPLNLIKLASSMSVILVCFGKNGWRRLIIGTGTFYAANLALAGAVFAVYSSFSPESVHIANGCFYVDFSLLVLIITTAALYGAVCAVRYFLDRGDTDCGVYEVVIRRGRDVTVLNGLADTGNCLVDHFTGAPVILCSGKKLGVEASVSDLPKGFRLLPCTTVTEDGLIPVFRPDEVVIRSRMTGRRKCVEAMVGLGNSGEEAVFNPKLLRI